MKNNKNAKKEIIRDQYIKIRVSQQEKDMWNEYARILGIHPTRLARNVLLQKAYKNKLSKGFDQSIVKSYKYYCKVTNKDKEIKRIENDKPEDDFKSY